MLIRGPHGTATDKTSMKQQYTSLSSASALMPPLKSARYCKKQRQRNGQTRAFTPSLMLMYESSINHNRLTHALNELSTSTSSSSSSSIFDYSVSSLLNHNHRPISFSKCQKLWDEYLECDEVFTKTAQEFSLLSLSSKSPVSTSDLESCPRVCYAKIAKSIRKLLKRTFTGAPSFSELETLVKDLLFFDQESESTSTMKNRLKFSSGKVMNLSESGATVQLDIPHHRVWLHAICQYYGLSSQSKSVHEDRYVHIKLRSSSRKGIACPSPKINLYNFLLQF